MGIHQSSKEKELQRKLNSVWSMIFRREIKIKLLMTENKKMKAELKDLNKLLNDYKNAGSRNSTLPSEVVATPMNSREEIELEKAYAQFIGWRSGKSGESISDLVCAMGLSEKEWVILKGRNSFDDALIDEVEDYFLKNG